MIQKFYAVVPTVELTDAMVNACKRHFNVTGNAASNSLRISNDRSKTIVKFTREDRGIFSNYTLLDEQGILPISRGEDWVTAND